MLKITLCLLLLAVTSTSAQGYPRCKQHFMGIGCYKDLVNDGRALPKLLFNNRTGGGVQWRDWPHHTHSVVCLCAEEAKTYGYTFFAVQFFGECWAGNNASFVNYGESKDCVDSSLKACQPARPRQECVGESSTNFVYGRLNGPPPVVKPTYEEKPELEKANCAPEMNIAIAMDTSGSVSDADFATSKEFVKNFIKSFGDKTRFAMLHYDNLVFIDFTFSDNQDHKNLAQKIDAFNHTRGATVTQRALALSRNLFNFKTDARKVLLVLTDGKTHGGQVHLVEPVKNLTEANVAIVAVGIGAAADDRELKVMGGEHGSLHVQSFDNLEKYQNHIKKLVCEKKVNINPASSVEHRASKTQGISVGHN